MEKNKEVSFQLRGIELLNVQLNHPEKPLSEQIPFHFDVNVEHRINTDNKLVIVICTVKILNKKEGLTLGSLKASCVFEIANMNDFVDEKNENKVTFPQNTLITFNSITISTIRGIMFSQFKGTFLHNAQLPVINPQSFISTK